MKLFLISLVVFIALNIIVRFMAHSMTDEEIEKYVVTNRTPTRCAISAILLILSFIELVVSIIILIFTW